METKPEDPVRPASQTAAVHRNICILFAVGFVAYALFGYFTDNIMILGGASKYGGTRRFAHGEQALWAAFGYVSFAIAALLFAMPNPLKPAGRPQHFHFSGTALIGIVFALIGLALVGFRVPG